MHILATFATLCCQTRWPRNHSCTTQEHVSFFRTFSGHFRKFRLFRHFLTNFDAQICKFACKHAKKHISQMRTLLQKSFHKCAHICKNISTTCSQTFLHMRQNTNAQICKCAKNVSCTKCANLQRKLFFQMQKSQICTVHKNTNATFCTCHKFTNANNLFCQMCKNVSVRNL